MGHLISNDPLTRIQETMHTEGDNIVLLRSQDATPVEEANKGEFNLNTSRFGKGFAHKVASIPSSIWYTLVKEGIANDEKALKKWLNDPENAVFKTKPVHL